MRGSLDRDQEDYAVKQVHQSDLGRYGTFESDDQRSTLRKSQKKASSQLCQVVLVKLDLLTIVIDQAAARGPQS